MPINNEMMKITRKTKNKNLAMPAAAPATPPKPRSAATKAITRKTAAQYNIFHLLSALGAATYMPVRLPAGGRRDIAGANGREKIVQNPLAAASARPAALPRFKKW
jgi:hypothetical protein